jgi:hypothetical protein
MSHRFCRILYFIILLYLHQPIMAQEEEAKENTGLQNRETLIEYSANWVPTLLSLSSMDLFLVGCLEVSHPIGAVILMELIGKVKLVPGILSIVMQPCTRHFIPLRWSPILNIQTWVLAILARLVI